MDIELAAQRLLESVNAPPGAITVLAWDVGDQKRLRVFVDPMYRYAMSNIPSVFEGFTVSVEAKKPSFAQ